jgi:uncharacterized DUF497 family protein
MPGGYTFEWDPEKARLNARKHGVTFEQATEVFRDPAQLSIYDDEHSTAHEDRWITMGRADEILVVVHTFVAVTPGDALIRIISARQATKREERQYEENG